MKDLTKGKPSTLILAFALPIFFANLLQLTYSLVDTRIVGTFLGEDALAAVGATTTLSNLIIRQERELWHILRAISKGTAEHIEVQGRRREIYTGM